jgi:serine/threonine protein kinase
MAPEILRGEKYCESADVYSYGVILWEMITGDIPYMGRSVA